MTIAWFNGDFTPLENLHIPATDRGFLLGDGLFETMRVEMGYIFYLKDHIARLEKSLMKMGFPIVYSYDYFLTVIQKLIRQNNALHGSYAIRLTVSRGSGPRGLLAPSPAKPNVLMTLMDGPAHLPPAKLCYSLYQINENAPSSGLKTLSYADQVIAFESAKAQGCDDAILFNSKGLVAEGTMSNIFIVIDKQIITPGIWCGALPGIMRHKILELDRNIQEGEITRDMIDQADEIFLSNSLIKLRPVSQLGQKLLNNHSVMTRLSDQLSQFETNMIQASTA